jgi:phage shock protein PspC (stress-responsive transcriptional regulator)
MKRTIRASIAGQIFQVDEDGYYKLDNYLKSIEQHYHSTIEAKEIAEDIEFRIAELLTANLANKDALSLQDINEVIHIIGQPDDFPKDDEEDSEMYYRAKAPVISSQVVKKLYRDSDNRVIAGVCSGLGAYFDVDPVLFRVLFLVALIAGGSGVLLYIILWIGIPNAITTTQKLEMRGKRIVSSF